MHYVYLLISEKDPEQRYIGVTADLRRRLVEHNFGKSKHTTQFVPWRFIAYIAFTDERRATQFERYLKSGSGHAFARRHVW